MATEHHLKIDPELFDAVRRRDKTAEIRRDDRGFNIGDVLIIYPFDRESGQRVGTDECHRVVTHKVDGGQFGIEAGYCLLSMN
ncbi:MULTISPECIES: DUF3850 domain-containing protein [Shewanella]|uniref:DUF3850 domain-containing protein n=1 Tax=Shewanella TaxID=22 RepID=UPI000B3484D1|nr:MULTISPECIES: DUF3850 domain-containing protein [Shewanella]AYV11533.1 DUF3850 domain-containing protein [Shewanella algae]QXN27429.1 DUF3850 domain-containing protein [Shewanella putrefaciens]